MSRLLDADELADAMRALARAVEVASRHDRGAALSLAAVVAHIAALTERLADERAESDRFHRELRDALTGNRQAVQR